MCSMDCNGVHFWHSFLDVSETVHVSQLRPSGVDETDEQRVCVWVLIELMFESWVAAVGGTEMRYTTQDHVLPQDYACFQEVEQR